MWKLGRKILVLLAAVALLGTAQAQADSITTLYNTGIDVNTDASDKHYTLDGGKAYLCTLGGGWVANSSLSRWISPSTNNTGTSSNVSTHVYKYVTTFSLAGLDADTAMIVFKMSVDDIVKVYLNGTLVKTISSATTWSSDSAWTKWYNFTVDDGFVAGTNTLEFDVVNSGSGPTGLNVQMTGTACASSVPLPGAFTLLAPGLLGLVGVRRRKIQ